MPSFRKRRDVDEMVKMSETETPPFRYTAAMAGEIRQPLRYHSASVA